MRLMNWYANSPYDDELSIQQLQQFNHTLKSIIDSSYDPIVVVDHNGVGILMNEAYTRTTGLEQEDIIGRYMEDLLKEGVISESVTAKVFKEKRPVTVYQKVKDVELLSTGNPVFDDQGKITHVVINLRDVSDLNRLRSELTKAKALAKRYLDEIESFKQKEGARLLLDGVIAHSKEIISVLRIVRKVAEVNSTVLLLGESGVGKEVIANTIHLSSKRADQPYVKVNCGAIPEQLLESELFGYEKGAFTGADQKGKPGFFEQANGGTIFLDEIGEMPLDLQVKLLRVLQQYEIVRLGGTKTVKVDVRVIAATNRNLDYMVKSGKFREDLFYRLNIVPIRIPPLRERRADITPLLYYFLSKMNEKYMMNKRLSPEVIHVLEQYHWPGNIREMENLIERLVVTSEQDDIDVEHLPEGFLKYENKEEGRLTLKEKVEELERKVIREAMKEHKTTRKAATALGISQSALVKKMKHLDLRVF